MAKETLEIVTEIGTFGELNIDDPSTKVLKEAELEDEEDMDKLAKKILEQE